MKRHLLPIALLVFTVPLGAQDAQDRAIRLGQIAKLSAATSGDRGMFNVSSVETLNRNQYSLGVGWNNFDRTPRDLDINSAPVFFAYGITGRLTLTGTLEVYKQVTARNLPQPGFYNTLPFVSNRFSDGSGDFRLGAKYRIQRMQNNVGGISLAGFVKFPNAEATSGLGTGEVDAGLELTFTSVLPLNFQLNSTAGVIATSDATTPTRRGIRDELRSGIGVAWPATGASLGGSSVLQGIFEYSNVAFIGAGTPNRAVQSPSDIVAGLRYMILDHGWSVSAGYRRNTNFDKTFPGNDGDHGFVIGLSYTRPVDPVVTNNFPLVLIDAPAESVDAGGRLEITAIGFDADDDPLTYAWTTTGGQIAGTGETVTFDATGLEPGEYTIRVMVTDGTGGSAQAQIRITVE